MLLQKFGRHLLKQNAGNDISIQTYPIADNSLINIELDREFELLIGVIRTTRNLRAEADIKPLIKVTLIVQSDSEIEREILERGKTYICDSSKG